MNSFRTREDSLAVLERYPDLPGDLPPDFVQNKEPKLDAETLDPVEWEADPDLEWCPPGHGDIYPALVASGAAGAAARAAATRRRSCPTPTTSAPRWTRAS